MRPRPLVSIITPSLNQGSYLDQAIASVAAQNYPNLEHIVVDGGSRDQSLSILRANQRRLRWISEPDSGTTEAIGKGVALSKGQYFWMINADDLFWDSGSLDALVTVLDRVPDADFVYGDMDVVNAQGRLIGRRRFGDYDVPALIRDRRHLPFPGCLMRRAVYERIGGLRHDLKFANDLEYYLRIAMQGRLVHLARPTGILRIHPLASTQRHVAQSGLEVRAVCLDYLQRALDAGMLEGPAASLRAAIELFSASSSFHSRRSAAVRRHCAEAVRLAPGLLANPKWWLYLLGSLAGDAGMAALSRLSRGLINRPGWFCLNNLKSFMPR